ncbi:MAG: GFA family protein [Pseudomonadales bacterium]
MPLTGECFCGEIKYQIDGELTDARSCHCSRCRKVFSAQASAYALVNPNDFKWLQGEDLLSSYIGEHDAGVRFCSQCGSTLCGVFNGEVHGITLGCLNEDPDIALARHIFVGSKASWETIAEGVPQFVEHAPIDAVDSESVADV